MDDESNGLLGANNQESKMNGQLPTLEDLKKRATSDFMVDQDDVFQSIESISEFDPWLTLENQVESFQDGETVQVTDMCTTLHFLASRVRLDKSEAVRASEKCDVLVSVCLVGCDSVFVQFAWKPQPAVGRHRVLVATILASILEGGRDYGFDESGAYFEGVFTRVEQSQLLKHLLPLALERPHASVFHCLIVRCVGAVVERGFLKESCKLLSQILSAQVGEQKLPLFAAIRQIVLNNSQAPQGQRPSVCSMCINLAYLMKNLPTGVLQQFQDDNWASFVQQGGKLDEILTEQNREMGGVIPRPGFQFAGLGAPTVKSKAEPGKHAKFKQQTQEQQEKQHLSTGQMLSGQEILSMLQSFCGFGQTNYVPPLRAS